MAQHPLLLSTLLLAAVLLVVMPVCIAYFAIRNVWVYRQRIALNNSFYAARTARLHAGDRTMAQEPWWDAYYMTYGQMMWRFWCWDIERMRLPSAPQTVGE
jgi:hypothetical protein